MAEYLIQGSTLTAIGDAIRAKTNKTDAILVSDLANEISGISTGAELNFELKAYSTEEDLTADLPKENTIGIITETPFENWTFSYTEPSGTFENGHIWIKTALSSAGEFNAIKNNDIRIYPSSLFQYVDGSWVSKSGRIYKASIGWNGFGIIPEFTYTGSYQIVDDNDAVITESLRDWKIRFLTSGKLIFTNLNNAANGIDIFLCGGGAGGVSNGGGGGGYTKTSLNYKVEAGIEYDIVVGAGGNKANGGASSFGNYDGTLTANGGKIGGSALGGAGGSGGGAGGGGTVNGGAGGSNGGNGSKNSGSGTGGKGQGTTTREFGESTGKLYAGGGGGGTWQGTNGAGGAGGGGAGARYNTSTDGKAGTNYLGGGGGGFNGRSPGKGGTGIVIIRNKRG